MQLSLADRAPKKHENPEGIAFASVKGDPSEMNAQGQKLLMKFRAIIPGNSAILSFIESGDLL
ncbi:hypothetical protein H7698_02520 [Pseudomonas sp. p50]|uniref:hypothetical protein n=1 Tax=Pseudomonas sp. p50(2008) TaxID=2816832 RepID=UPI00188AF6F8|nr:hypothetical protein [Pseudomonas sp. p50(2008)]MBF4554929.1 hypothetical protein [Pseudomonas sp. p50(2008)]